MTCFGPKKSPRSLEHPETIVFPYQNWWCSWNWIQLSLKPEFIEGVLYFISLQSLITLIFGGSAFKQSPLNRSKDANMGTFGYRHRSVAEKSEKSSKLRSSSSHPKKQHIMDDATALHYQLVQPPELRTHQPAGRFWSLIPRLFFETPTMGCDKYQGDGITLIFIITLTTLW
jgi:hypothetical protein